MAKGMSDDMWKAIKQGFIVIAGAVAIVGLTFLVMMVYGLLIGAFNYQAQTGNIGVDNITLTELNTTVSEYWTQVRLVTASVAIVVGFIALVILFAIFAPFISGGKKMFGGSGNTSF